MNKYIRDSSDILKKSFYNLNSKSLLWIFFDIILVALLAICLMSWFNMLMEKSSSLSSMPLGNIMEASPEKIKTVNYYLMSLFFSIVGGLFLVFIIMMAAFSLLKGYTWASSYKKKLDAKIFFKAFAFNSLLALLLFIPLISFVMQKSNEISIYQNTIAVILIICVIIFVYFNELFFYNLLKSRKFFHSLKLTFIDSSMKIHLIIPYHIAFWICLTLILLTGRIIPYPINMATSFLLALLFFALSRNIFSLVFEKYLG